MTLLMWDFDSVGAYVGLAIKTWYWHCYCGCLSDLSLEHNRFEVVCNSSRGGALT